MSVGLGMKLQFAVVAVLLASLLVLASVNIVQAQWSAIDSGFAVTTNWHGKDVLIGESVTATAGWAPALAPQNPNNKKSSAVYTVEFVWHNATGHTIWDVTVTISGPLTTPAVPPGPLPQEIIDWANLHDGMHYQGGNLIPTITYYYANDTQKPNSLGDWGVQAKFHDSDHNLQGANSDIIAVKATSFNVVPEVPFGTIVILLSWFGVLGVFALRKKHFHE